MYLNLKLSGLALGLAAAVGLALSAPASAQDQWDGFYFGKHAGFGSAVREGCTSWDFFGPTPTSCEEGNGSAEIYTEYSGFGVGKQAALSEEAR